MAKVNKYTRAGQNGKVISCPSCKQETKVYHFSWAGLECSKCENMIDKEKWNISKNQKSI